MTERLAGRRVLITGASSGIGAQVARAVAAEGGRVALLARREAPLLALADELGGVAVPADVSDTSGIAAAVDAAGDGLGGLDGLFNAAGVLLPGTVADTGPAVWRRMFDVNVLGLLEVTRAAIPHLRAAGQSDVVNVSSMSGRRLNSAELGVYGASKAAVHMLSEGLRRELGPDGVRVTVLAPGLVATDLFGESDDPVSARLRDRAGEVGLTAEDVAASVVHVLSAPPGVVHVEVDMLSLRQG